MTNDLYDSDEVNTALALIKSIKEVPNPAYRKAMRDRKAFSPQRESISMSNEPMIKSVGEQMRQELDEIRKVCDKCPECMDCAYAMSWEAWERCRIVKSNLSCMAVLPG
jgi:hypothetical protein